MSINSSDLYWNTKYHSSAIKKIVKSYNKSQKAQKYPVFKILQPERTKNHLLFEPVLTFELFLLRPCSNRSTSSDPEHHRWVASLHKEEEVVPNSFLQHHMHTRGWGSHGDQTAVWSQQSCLLVPSFHMPSFMHLHPFITCAWSQTALNTQHSLFTEAKSCHCRETNHHWGAGGGSATITSTPILHSHMQQRYLTWKIFLLLLLGINTINCPETEWEINCFKPCYYILL